MVTLRRIVPAAVGIAALMASYASAGQLVYQPTNPTFGGNALNGSFLLSTAQTQGAGVKSGQQQTPDLSGLNSALGNLGDVGSNSGAGSSPIIVIGNGTVPTNP
jgi:curli production assembly/transport component CsgF